MVRYYLDLTQLVIALEVEVPRVWRGVHVSSFAKLGGLHRVIQGVMEWDNRQRTDSSSRRMSTTEWGLDRLSI
jgi:hypothetical protein